MVRLVVIPAILFTVVSVTVFTVAKLHPAKRGRQTPTLVTVIVDSFHGKTLFAERCATCHGEGGQGGGVGPTLAGRDVSLDEARETIENGSGVMPAGLVTGQDLEDVLGYLETILASP
jgi:cytochrome c553